MFGSGSNWHWTWTGHAWTWTDSPVRSLASPLDQTLSSTLSSWNFGKNWTELNIGITIDQGVTVHFNKIEIINNKIWTHSFRASHGDLPIISENTTYLRERKMKNEALYTSKFVHGPFGHTTKWNSTVSFPWQHAHLKVLCHDNDHNEQLPALLHHNHGCHLNTSAPPLPSPAHPWQWIRTTERRMRMVRRTSL